MHFFCPFNSFSDGQFLQNVDIKQNQCSLSFIYSQVLNNNYWLIINGYEYDTL